MPKIPTFTSTEEMTTQTGAVTSDLQISPANNIFTATQDLQKTLTKEYVKSVRPGYSLHPKYLNKIIGKKLRKNLKKGSRIKVSFFK